MGDGQQPNSREEYERKIAADIIKRQVGQPQDANDIIAAEPDEEPEVDEIKEETAEKPEQKEQPAQSTPRIQQTPEEQLAEGEVPKYAVESPGAYKQPPGGPAIQPQGAPEAGAEAGAPKRRGIGGAYDNAKQKVSDTRDQVLDWAKEQIKKLAWKAIKEAAAAAVKAAGAFLAEGGWFPVLMIICAVILIVVAFSMFANMRARGSTIVQAADILDDHPLIKTVLALSNQADFQKFLDENKDKLTNEINSLESDLNAKYFSDPKTATTITQLDAVKTLIAAYNEPDATKAKEIGDKLVAAVKPWSVILNPSGMIFPASGYSAKNISNNYRSGHAGIDVVLPIGTPLHAATSGTIVYLVDNIANWALDSDHFGDKSRAQNGGFGNMMIVKMDLPVQGAQYWEIHHLSPGTATKIVNGQVVPLQKNDHVNQGDVVALSGHNGSSSKQHLHFGTCSQFRGTSCNTSGGYTISVDPKKVLGWK